jgi:hypothetical protein
MNLDSVVEEFVQEATIDYVGFWELFVVVADDIEDKRTEDIRQVTLELARRLLLRGFRAGEFTGTGEGVVPWPDQNLDAIMRRIEGEWNDLGRDPNINDICWFIGPK